MKIQYQHYHTLPSTNSFCKEQLTIFDENDLHVISAEEQTQGRGRGNKSWVSPEGNLFASFAFHLGKDFEYKTSPLGIILATVVAEYQESLGLPFQIKWPNDLLLNRLKVGGLLGEAVSDDSGVWVILGLGVNLHMSEKELNSIEKPATSLHLFMEEVIDPSAYLKEIAPLFQEAIVNFKKEGFAPFFPLWKKYNALQKGQPLELETSQGRFSCTFDSLEEDGAISIINNGDKKKFYSAEII